MFYSQNNVVNNFLEENALWLALTLVILIIAVIIIYAVLSRRKNIQTKQASDLYTSFLGAFGGEENITALNARGSRVSVVLKDFSLFDASALKAIGLENYVVMTTKITVVIGEEAQVIATTWSKSRHRE